MWFKNLFRRKKVDIDNKTADVGAQLSILDSFINLPSKKSLSKGSYNALLKYKQEYKTVIASRKTLLSSDLNVSDFRATLKMYIDLLSNLILETENGVNKCLVLESECSKGLRALIKDLKLKEYLNNIYSLREEIMLRLMALKEIYSESFWKSKSKKEAILSEVNNLESNYLAVTQGEMAAQVMAKNYETEYIDFYGETSDEAQYKDVLMKWRVELRGLAKKVIPDTLGALDKEKIEPILKVAILECLLEKYVYENADVAKTLDDKLSILINEWKKRKFASSEIYASQELLDEVNEIGLFYKIFGLFGRDIVSEQSLMKIHDYKLDLLLHFYDYEKNNSLPNDISNFEKSYMVKVLEKKLIDLVSGKFDTFREQFGENYIDAIEIVKKMCRDESNKLNFIKVFEDFTLAKLIMSLDEENGIYKFFDRIKVNISGLSFARGIYWEDIVPWSSKLMMEYFGGVEQNCLYNRLFSKLSILAKSEKYFCLPEGIEYIDWVEDLKSLTRKNIRKRAKNRIVKMPTTFKVLRGRIFRDLPIKRIILNEGIQDLNLCAINKAEFIEVPPSLESSCDIPSHLKWHIGIQTIQFNNYTKSLLLNNNVEFRNEFLKDITQLLSKDYIKWSVDGLRYFVTFDQICLLEEIRFQDDSLSEDIIVTEDDMRAIKVYLKRYRERDVPSLDAEDEWKIEFNELWNELETIINKKRRAIESKQKEKSLRYEKQY